MPKIGLGKSDLFKLTFTPEVPKQWRHFSIVALALLVATIGLDTATLPNNPITTPIGQTAPRTEAVSLADVALPKVKAIDLPPVPVRNEGVTEPHIAADGVMLMDDESKVVLYEKKGDQKRAVASTTKIMTAVTAVDHYKDLDKRVTLSNRSINQIGSAVGFHPGETATIRQLLWGLMSVSGNDAAMALSEQMTPAGGEGSTQQFMAAVNKKAQQLGMKDSHFLDPAGLNDNGYSTPADMAKAMSELLKKPELVEMIGTLNYAYTSPEGVVHQLNNSNRLIGEMAYRGIIGGKTGFTPRTPEGTGAGHCLVAAAERDGHTLIVTVFDTYETSWQASAKVARDALEYGFNNFTWQKVNR